MRKTTILPKQKMALLLLVVVCLAAVTFPALAHTPEVKAVLFFSPTCPHCEKIITDVLPPLGEKYDDQLNILLVNVMEEEGQALYQSAIKALQIPDDRLGVPTLVIDKTVLVGSGEIPEKFPAIIEEVLAADGNDWPPIPGLIEVLKAGEQPARVEVQPAATDEPTGQTAASAPTIIEEPTFQKPTWQENFAHDPVANSMAVALEIIMLLSVLAIAIGYIVDAGYLHRGWPAWVIPVLCVLGLGVSIYLSYVEVTASQAVCGPVGDCNSVQASPYAKVFGLIPVGIMGVAGYVAILAAWLVSGFGPALLQKLVTLATWGMAWFGILFSIYLTFLEPFVIGATCMWCLSQAVAMTLVFWASTPPALQALQHEQGDEEPLLGETDNQVI